MWYQRHAKQDSLWPLTALGPTTELDGAILLLQIQTIHFLYRNRYRNLAVTELEASSLIGVFHTARRCYTGC